MINLEVVAAGADRECMANLLEAIARDIRKGAEPTGAERKPFQHHGAVGSYWLQDTEAVGVLTSWRAHAPDREV